MELPVDIFNVPPECPDFLLEAIKKSGVIEPIILDPFHHTLLDGEKRIACCKKLGISKIPYKYSEMTREEVELYVAERNKEGHLWKEVEPTSIMFGPHVWQCSQCKEWTISSHRPKAHAPLINPDTKVRYSGNQSVCIKPNELYKILEVISKTMPARIAINYVNDQFEARLGDKVTTAPTIEAVLVKLNALMDRRSSPRRIGVVAMTPTGKILPTMEPY